MNALAATTHVKPFDFGTDGLTGSLNQTGQLIALNFYHPKHGYVTLTTAEPFPEHERYNPTEVRAYRASLANLPGFGYAFVQSVVSHQSTSLEDAISTVELEFAAGGKVQIITLDQGSSVTQRWQCTGVIPRWRGRISLQRCAYTQLTEGGPISAPPVKMIASFQNGALVLENPLLGCAVAIVGLPHGEAWEQQADGALTVDLPGHGGESILGYGVGLTLTAALDAAWQSWHEDFDKRLAARLQMWKERWAGIPPNSLIRRGLVYGLSMCVQTGAGTCILTDHMLLPLAWNRDAYYVALALLHWQPSLRRIVKQHLVWLFETAERIDQTWGRCYLANGKIKDQAYQLDQQLFPLLELADYVITIRDTHILAHFKPQVDAVVESLLQRKAQGMWLFPTDETPADDPIALPYHLSSHILLWYTLMRLQKAGLGDHFATMAQHLWTAINDYFVIARAEQSPIYAYAVDGAGRSHLYHDANDLPLALAPLWGFVAADDPTWRATIEFAFSEANIGGFHEGRLGSVHTRAAWSLGDIQDLLIALVTNDSQRERQAWHYLRKAAQRDGALPEAYDPHSGAVISRYWFAWPSAALACVELGAYNS